ncbi:MAG: LacI family transcriptional regulator [Acidobacteria bacterium]|nr:LacI family transcriptional regulator [Acidobacteriota bacterium]
MAVTLKEIARELGVSVVTVSKVLRNHEDISKKTRDRVLECAKELGYRPNLTARSLVTGRSSLVGLVVPDLIHPFFAEVARSLAATLRKQNLYLLVCSSEGDPELERNQVEHLLSRHLDAIVIASIGSDEEVLRNVVVSRTPLILIDRKVDIPYSHFVGANDVVVGSMATEHLIAMGCRRIAHLRGPDNSVGKKRLEGYKKALAKAGMAFDPKLVTSVSTGDVESKAQGAEYAKQLFAGSSKPDGLFCFSDPMAIGAMQSAIEAGLNIPKDLAMIGCGNLHYDNVLRIPLSSVDQKSERVGQRAAELILEQVIRGRYDVEPEFSSQTFANVQLKPEVIVRESSRRR